MTLSYPSSTLPPTDVDVQPSVGDEQAHDGIVRGLGPHLPQRPQLPEQLIALRDSTSRHRTNLPDSTSGD